MSRRRRRWLLAALALTGFLLTMAVPTARALPSGGEGSGEATTAALGGYTLASKGNGLLLTFDAIGLLPAGASRLVQVGLPEAQATGIAGPSNYALASLLYPGDLLANLPALAAQAGLPKEVPPLPGYPIQARAYYPAGPTTSEQPIGTTTATATAEETASESQISYSAADLPDFIATGSMTVHASEALESGRAVSQLRSEVADLDLLGILHIGSVTTDIRADSNGATAASAGSTKVTGVKFLGLDATIDGTGVHLVNAPDSGGTPLVDPVLGSVDLEPISSALNGISDGLSQLITSTVGATGSLNDLLQQAGVSIRVLSPVASSANATADSPVAAANRFAAGLQVQLDYNPHTNATLKQLVDLIPSSQLPQDQLIPGLPLSTSPQGLAGLLAQVYRVTFSLGSGEVTSQSNAAYQFPAVPIGGTEVGTDVGGVPGSGTDLAFSTPAPALPAAPSGSGGAGLTATQPLAVLFDSLPAGLVLLVLLSIPLWALAAGRFADRTVAVGAVGCPTGHDIRPGAPS